MATPTYEHRYDLYRLWDIVGEVARYENADQPERLSTRRFDALKGELGHAGAPTAVQIARRMKMPWPRVVATALDPNRSRTQTVGRLDAAEKETFSEAECLVALRAAAIELGLPRLERAQYEVARERLLKRAPDLPTGNQIAHRLGSWKQALELAGMGRPPRRAPEPDAPTEQPEGTTAETNGAVVESESPLAPAPLPPPPVSAPPEAPAVPTKRPAGVPVAEAIDFIIDAYGIWPSNAELTRIRETYAFSIAAFTNSIEERVAEVTARRAARGLTTPPPPNSGPGRRHRLRLDQRVPGFERPPHWPPPWAEKHTRESCVETLVRCLLDLGQTYVTKRDYDVWRERQPDRLDIPRSNLIQKKERWPELVDEAWARIEEGRAPTPGP